jgi:4-amino-4-deoxy-L-arabinose transferase-like glycosyltransferase
VTRSVAAALLVGLAARLFALWFFAPSNPVADEIEYWYRASSMVAGRDVVGEDKRPPGSIWWYALFLRTFGEDRRAAQAANIVAGVAVVAIAAMLGRRFGGHRTMNWTAWAAALHPTFVIYSVSLWSEPLYTALALGGLLLLASGSSARIPLVACGALFGAAALTREVGIFLPAVAGIWFVSRGGPGRSAWPRVALVCVGFAAVLVPWTIRQNEGSNVPVLVSRTTWKNLYVGNAPFPKNENRVSQRAGAGTLYREYTSLGKDLEEREAKAKEIALAAIRERMPLWPAEKFVEAVPALLTPNALPVARLLARPEDPGWGGNSAYVTELDGTAAEPLRDVLAWTIVLVWTVIVLAGAAGLALAHGGAPVGLFLLFIGFHVLPTVITFGTSRFRLPFEPLLLIAAIWLLSGGRRPWQGAAPSRKAAAALAVGTAALVLASQWRALLQPQYG